MTLTAPPDTLRADGRDAPTRRPGAAERLARWSTRHRWTALLLWIALVVAAVAGGSIAGTKTLTDGDTGAGESGRAASGSAPAR